MHILIEYLVFTDKSNYTIYIHDYTIKKNRGILIQAPVLVPAARPLLRDNMF